MRRLGPAGAPGSLRARTYTVIFEHETGLAKRFDEVLLVAILASVAVVMLDSVGSLRAVHGRLFLGLEWFFTGLFTVEYLARLWSVDRPRRYAGSFFGIVDLLAVVPTYLSILVPGGQFFIVVRILRVLRVFRIMKLAQYVGEANVLGRALRASRFKITVFLLAVLNIVVVVGAVMYLVEGPEAGFTSIPRGVYWAVVTLTTVGYGDIAPMTTIGQALAAVVMIMGYGIIAVPTGIVTTELGRQAGGLSREAAEALEGTQDPPRPRSGHPAGPDAAGSRRCRRCGAEEEDRGARYCRYCGTELPVRG